MLRRLTGEKYRDRFRYKRPRRADPEISLLQQTLSTNEGGIERKNEPDSRPKAWGGVREDWSEEVVASRGRSVARGTLRANHASRAPKVAGPFRS